MADAKESIAAAQPPPPSYAEAIGQPPAAVAVDRAEIQLLRSRNPPQRAVQLKSLTRYEAHSNVRTPISLTMVLDKSGSMNTAVTGCLESSGYTRMDLLRHCMNVILANLSADDYMSIITFSDAARVLMPRLPMTQDNVTHAKQLIQQLQAGGMTNLPEGLKTAYQYLRVNPLAQSAEQFINRHIVLLTDGQPNVPDGRSVFATRTGQKYNDPAPYLQLMDEEIKQCPASQRTLLHAFGLCHDDLDDKLLCKLAERGHGMYGFISDATIITPCFINIMAQWFHMMVTGMMLRVTQGGVTREHAIPWIPQTGAVTTFLPYDLQPDAQITLESNTMRRMRLQIDDMPDSPAAGTAIWSKSLLDEVGAMLTAACDGGDSSNPLQPRVQAILQHIQSKYSELPHALAPLADGIKIWVNLLRQDVNVYERIKAESLALWDRQCLRSLAMSLLDDYVSNGYEKSYKTLAGLRLAHWLESVEMVAKNIQPPNPSIQPYLGDAGRARGPAAAAGAGSVAAGGAGSVAAAAAPAAYRVPPAVAADYSSYWSSSSGRDMDDGCVDGECLVEMADGSHKRVRDVVMGDLVRTDSETGVGRVRCSLLWPTISYVALPGGLRLTHMHPVRADDGDWMSPCKHSQQQTVTLEQPLDMYSFLLDPAVPGQSSNAMRIQGWWVAHFAHNSQHRVLLHEFYGTDKMRHTVDRIDPEHKGRIRITGAVRGPVDGVVCDYLGETY